MLVEFDTPISAISGIAPKVRSALKNLRIETVRDLLSHLPTRYEDWSRVTRVKHAPRNRESLVCGTVESSRIVGGFGRWRPNNQVSIFEAEIRDESGAIRAIWFGQPYLARTLKKGTQGFFFGKVLSGKRGIFLSNPEFELIAGDEEPIPPGLLPVYRETRGLTSKGIRKAVRCALALLNGPDEFIPREIVQRFHLPEISEALRAIHAPRTLDESERARRRFEFEELFLFQLHHRIEREKIVRQEAPRIEADLDFLKTIIASLPFTLTFSQKRSLLEIVRDLAKPYPMNRLLQGDVGSGKTVVAALAALLTARSGLQAAFMAPTEVLAAQHFGTLAKLFGAHEHPIALVTSKTSLVRFGDGLETKLSKMKLAREVSAGNVKIIVGTHALIAASGRRRLVFPKLGLVIVDEQHRFGVRQRGELATGEARGGAVPSLFEEEKFTLPIPHFLSMSATPIPRTLAITVFGDLDLSAIDELPAGRKPIVTKIVNPANRAKAYAFIRGQVRRGRQAFVICPRIEPSDTDYPESEAKWSAVGGEDAKTVKAEYEKLSKRVFPDLRVGLMHGRLKSGEKQSVMEQFKRGDVDILVATSVIEVGVDVPNATLMVIEGAERFGLAQLYQFRGRVGRGGHQSFCLLFTDSTSEATLARLHALLEAKNGFELAEKDLALRGPGELLGTEQTGVPDTVMQALRRPQLVGESREAAHALIEKDSTLSMFPALRGRLDLLEKRIHLE